MPAHRSTRRPRPQQGGGRRSRLSDTSGKTPKTQDVLEPGDYEVIDLGRAGDGIAVPLSPDSASAGKKVVIPFTVPGDRVRIAEQGSTAEILVPSPDRTLPVCKLFGTCGGCRLQHVSRERLLTWKTALVTRALQQAGFTSLPKAEATAIPPATRRRADLALRRTHDGIILGLHQRHGLPLDLTECHVLHPDIMALLPHLRHSIQQLEGFGSSGDLMISLTDTGADLLLATDRALSSSDRIRLARLAEAHQIARISWRPKGSHETPETALQREAPKLSFNGPAVALPAGAFLQASREGEAAIRDAIIAALPRSPGRRAQITELYAGCGSFTFTLAEHARVEAFEGSAPAIAALSRAAGGLRISAQQRDLNRQPVTGASLSNAFAVVLDPPHMGAGAQMRPLVAAKPPVVIYVSCNPQALERDASQLHAAGYTVTSITVIDQFAWSAETETVVRFDAPGR